MKYDLAMLMKENLLKIKKTSGVYDDMTHLGYSPGGAYSDEVKHVKDEYQKRRAIFDKQDKLRRMRDEAFDSPIYDKKDLEKLKDLKDSGNIDEVEQLVEALGIDPYSEDAEGLFGSYIDAMNKELEDSKEEVARVGIPIVFDEEANYTNDKGFIGRKPHSPKEDRDAAKRLAEVLLSLGIGSDWGKAWVIGSQSDAKYGFGNIKLNFPLFGKLLTDIQGYKYELDIEESPVYLPKEDDQWRVKKKHGGEWDSSMELFRQNELTWRTERPKHERLEFRMSPLRRSKRKLPAYLSEIKLTLYTNPTKWPFLESHRSHMRYDKWNPLSNRHWDYMDHKRDKQYDWELKMVINGFPRIIRGKASPQAGFEIGKALHKILIKKEYHYGSKELLHPAELEDLLKLDK